MHPSREKLERRQALKIGFGMTSGLIAFATAGNALANCVATPAQMEGPFYPVADQIDKDADLTFVKGKDGKATGQVVYVHGTVKGSDCQPLTDAVVEIWQACASGRYDHPGDTSEAPLDPYFQYWGIARTDDAGRYVFKTIVPGAYRTGGGGVRTPHIHFKIHKAGVGELTTQMYFAGQALNGQDGLLRRLSSEELAQVVVRFEAAPVEYGPDTKIGKFDVTLGR